MAGQRTEFLRPLATCGAVTIAAATGATGAAAQSVRTYENIVMDDLVVCSELEGVTKTTLGDAYAATTRRSILSSFAAPRPVPPLPPGLRLFIATDGRLGDALLDCLSGHDTDQLDLVALTQKALASMQQPLPDDVFPDWMKLGPTIVSWATSCTGDDCIVTYVRWNYDPADAQAVLDDFLGLPD